ncbi:MAG: AAA family ATPase [Chlamydiales bacterium]
MVENKNLLFIQADQSDLKETLSLWKDKSLVDYYFAKKLAPDGEDSLLLFLGDLLKAAREGHFCIRAKRSLPSYLFKEALVQEKDRVYLKRNWDCEQSFIHHYHRLKSEIPSISIPDPEFEAVLQLEQKQAILHTFQRSLSLICGGPGTGKTFTAAVLIQKVIPYLKPIVAAPTGKAAANLRHALDGICDVHTLQSLLKKQYLGYDLVLVDEASMIDADLMTRLFSLINRGSRLVLVGDRDQLPPVETGHLFVDLAKDLTLVSELNKCLRTDLSRITEMARAVKEGRSVEILPIPDFATISHAVFEERVSILTPLRHTVDVLNKKLLKEGHHRGGHRFPIMICVNDPSVELYNGDVGELIPDEKCAYFGKKRVPECLLPRYDYAYVISVYKSQGSEYDEVMILLPEGSEVFGREMLYTAITRAKKKVTIYGSEEVLRQILEKKEHRLSGLNCS